MNVGFGLLTLFPGRVGGSESYVRGLLEQFSRGNGPERVTVLANRQVAAAYGGRVGGPVSLEEVRSYRAGDSVATRALAMAAARLAPGRVARGVPAGLDLLHLPVTVPIPRLDLPTVVTIHEVQLHDRPQAFSRAERRYRRWAYDGSARSADVVVAVTDYVRARLSERADVDPGRIETVHLGIDHTRFSPEPRSDDERVVARLGVPGRFVLYPANHWPHKNHDRLVEAFARVRDDSLTLVLAGQGYGRVDALLERARGLGLAERVRHLGHVAPDDMPALFRAATGLVFPSLYEGFGAPPLEAMACGCPVASSTAASLAEVCGDAVVQIDPEDPASIASGIERVTGDDAERQRLREAGLRQAARFTWESAAEGHLRAYERALSSERAT